MTTVLVTGAAGYIGSVLCPALLAAGHSVVALDSFRYGQHLALASCCANPNFSLVVGDVRDRRVYKPLLAKADVVIALAAIVGAPACDRWPDDATTTNYHAVQWLAASLSPNQLLIYPNSNSGYGIGSNEPCTEDSPLRPLSLYGRVKCQAEAAVLDHPSSVVFRLATVFGASPRMRTDLLVNDLTLRAVRDRSLVLYEGSFRRNFVHVRDVADAFAKVIDCWSPTGHMWREGVYNLGHDGANVTKRELCEIIRRHVEGFTYFESPLLHADPDQRDYVVSNARLRAAGFEATRTLDDGVVELLKLYAGFPQTQWGNV